MTRRSATSATNVIIEPRMKRSSRRGICTGRSVAKACPRSGPVEGVWGNREVPPPALVTRAVSHSYCRASSTFRQEARREGAIAARIPRPSLRAGASGSLLKDAPPEQLVAGIRAVCSGDALLGPSVTRRVTEEFVRHPPEAVRTAPPEIEKLTPRECEVLKLIARVLSNSEIAQSLVVGETTVKTHVAHVLMKMRLRDRVQAVVMACESGLVQPREADSAPSPS